METKMGTTKLCQRCKGARRDPGDAEPCESCGGTREDDLLAVGDEVYVMSVQRPTEAIRRGCIKAIRQVTEFGRPATIAQVGTVGTWLALWRLQKVARASEGSNV